MDTKKSVKPFSLQTGEKSLALFREWLMDGNDPNSFVDGDPLWVWLVENEWYEALDEAWQAGANPNTRDSMGRGWLHYAISHQLPVWVALEGFRQLDGGWWRADDLGRTPFHLPIYDEALAQAMVVRWWSEERSWDLLSHPFDPAQSSLPQAAHWKRWQRSLRA
jgi:hypothetical protein